MAKRKRETADEESATPEQQKHVKKQKTSNMRISQAKDAAPKHKGSEGSAQLPLGREDQEDSHKFAKRQRRALKKSQRDGLKRKDEIRTGEDDEDIRLVKTRGTKSLEKGHRAEAPNRHVSRKREKEGGQTLTGKHKSKKEKRRDKTVRPNEKKSKRKDIETATWKVSDPLGGQMLDVDPVFSPDEK